VLSYCLDIGTFVVLVLYNTLLTLIEILDPNQQFSVEG